MTATGEKAHGTQCAKMVWSDGAWRDTPCHRRAKWHEDGKDWCGHHRPSAVAAKQAKRDARWEAKSKQWRSEWDANDKVQETLAALRQMVREQRDDTTIVARVADYCAALDARDALNQESAR